MSTDPTAEQKRLIRLAISDPGATTPRGDDYREHIVDWQLRALMAQPEALAASLPAEVMLAALVDRGALAEEEWAVKCLCGKTLQGSPDEVRAWSREHDDSPKASHIVVWSPVSVKPWTRRHVTPGEVAP